MEILSDPIEVGRPRDRKVGNSGSRELKGLGTRQLGRPRVEGVEGSAAG